MTLFSPAFISRYIKDSSPLPFHPVFLFDIWSSSIFLFTLIAMHVIQFKLILLEQARADLCSDVSYVLFWLKITVNR